MDFVDFLKENNNEEEYYYYNDNNYSDTYNMTFTPKYNSNEEFIENFMRIGHTNELINKNLQFYNIILEMNHLQLRVQRINRTFQMRSIIQVALVMFRA